MAVTATGSAVSYDDIMAELQDINSSIGSMDSSGYLDSISSQIDSLSSDISSLGSDLSGQIDLLGGDIAEQFGTVKQNLELSQAVEERIYTLIESYCTVSLEYQSVIMGILVFFLACFVIWCVYKLFRIFI